MPHHISASSALSGDRPGDPLALLVRRLQNFSGRLLREDLTDVILMQKHFERDHPSWSERGDLANLFILERGFAFKFEILPNGQRHIADFYGPGAICNWSRLNAFAQQDDIVFKARTLVTLVDPAKLSALLDERPGIASAFKRHELARAMRTTQRIRTLISRSATEKMSMLLLDVLDEHNTIGVTPHWFTLPFTHQELADLLGITMVHVNRTFARLEDEGVIERERRLIRVINAKRLREALAYRSFFRTGDAA